MYILDTHTLLWFLFDSSELPSKTKELICSEKDVAVSIVSLWEIAIKQSIGKLKINYTMQQIEEICLRKNISVISILPSELDMMKTIPQIHNDPFDRLIICQAIYSAAILVTKDEKIRQYPVRTIWK